MFRMESKLNEDEGTMELEKGKEEKPERHEQKRKREMKVGSQEDQGEYRKSH